MRKKPILIHLDEWQLADLDRLVSDNVTFDSRSHAIRVAIKMLLKSYTT